MPIFDFTCKQCGHKFDLLIPNAEKDKVKCPQCGTADVRQLFSSFGTGATSVDSKIIKDVCKTCGMNNTW